MPIYEFYCASCHTVFNFLSKRINTDGTPACPKCGRPNSSVSPSAPAKVEQAPKGDKKGSAVLGATLGFAVGFMIVQQGCGNGNWVPLALFGGAIFAILGAILGALFG